jgi:hypothetical protein
MYNPKAEAVIVRVFDINKKQNKSEALGKILLLMQNCDSDQIRVSVQGVKSLGGHFAFFCRGFEFYEVKKINFVIIFQKENGNTFTLLIIFILKSLQKEQNSTNLLL